MAIGPGANLLVAKVDATAWGLDSLNSVGLVIVACNAVAMCSILCLLDEPKEKDPDLSEHSSPEEEGASSTVASEENGASDAKSDLFQSFAAMFKAFLTMDILVPMLSIFVFNANFQLIETGFAPAAHDALGWGPVESSVALGSISFIIALVSLCY